MRNEEEKKLKEKYEIEPKEIKGINHNNYKAISKLLENEILDFSAHFVKKCNRQNGKTYKKILKNHNVKFDHMHSTKGENKWWITISYPLMNHMLRKYFYIYKDDIADWLNNDKDLLETIKRNCYDENSLRYQNNDMSYDEIFEFLGNRIDTIMDCYKNSLKEYENSLKEIKDAEDIKLDNDANEIEDDLDL